MEFICSQCGKVYRDPGNLRRHVMIAHEGVHFSYKRTYGEFKCPYCGKVFKTTQARGVHSRRCTSNPNRVPGWSKGLTKETDIRLAHLSLAVREAAAKNPNRGKASTEEKEKQRKEKISSYAKSIGFGGLVRGAGKGIKGFYHSIFCESTLELVFVIYCLDHNIEIKPCDKYFIYEYEEKKHRYYPDFILGDGTIVEIKGWMIKQDIIKAKAAAMEGQKYKILFQEDLQKAFDWVRDHYTYENLSDLYDRES